MVYSLRTFLILILKMTSASLLTQGLEIITQSTQFERFVFSVKKHLTLIVYELDGFHPEKAMVFDLVADGTACQSMHA